MNSDDFNTIYLIDEESTFNNNSYNQDCYSNMKSLAKNNPALTTAIALASVVATASIVSPNVRKVTAPVFKYALKQQLKLLAGIGILSIANNISNTSNISYGLDETELM